MNRLATFLARFPDAKSSMRSIVVGIFQGWLVAASVILGFWMLSWLIHSLTWPNGLMR